MFDWRQERQQKLVTLYQLQLEAGTENGKKGILLILMLQFDFVHK
ncbi:hypothetical protein Hanom_Chr15g01383351 [Helianthus anomalus]